MKVLILGGSNSRNSGGVFNSARQLGIQMNKIEGVNVEFLMHSDEYSKEDLKFYDPLKVNDYKIVGPSSLGFSWDLSKKIEEINPDVIHTQTLWMFLSKVNLDYYFKAGRPYLISPRGMLDKWQLNQSFLKDNKKKLVLKLYEQKHLQEATCINALCNEEYLAIREFGLKNPVAIIPNGIYLPEDFELERTIYKKEFKDRKRLLFLSRIHRKKGLDNLLIAWSKTNPKLHDWKLTIAGETKDTEYWSFLNEELKRLKISDTVEFIGGMFGEDKRDIFIKSDAFILPSFSEGLPMAVLEAWSYKLPTILTPFCNLQEGFQGNASLEINVDVDSISLGIERMIGMSDESREAMGEKAFLLVKDKFTWEKVASKTIELYNWMLNKGDVPEFVKLD